MSQLFVFLLLLVSCAHTPDPAAIEKESARLNAFFDEVFEAQVERYPTWQTYLGRKTNYGLLDDESEEQAEREHQITKDQLKRLQAFNYKLLTPEAQASYDIFKYQLERSLEGYQWRYHGFPLNQMFGYQSEVPSFLINMHQVDSVDDARAYISRLKEIRRVFTQNLTWVKKQETLGIIPPKFVFPKVIADSQNIIKGIPFERGQNKSPLLEDFEQKVNKLKVSRKVKTDLSKEAQTALKEFVLPAYQELIEYLTALEKKSPGNLGASSLPRGKEYYNFKLRTSTTLKLSADEIHQIGLSEVARIQKEMHQIMNKVGFRGTLQEFFQHMRGSQYHYPDTMAGRKAYLAEVDRVLGALKPELPQLFKTFPKAELVVKPVESFREKSAGTAFYTSPSLEGNRPGIYYVNLYKMADNPKYKLEALAYHEAIPGHHMQIAIARELQGLPKFRRTSGFTAYSEGWGLYAEQLPKEIGFYQDPYSDFGRLSMEIWRAVRLVVDTGIHAKDWSREKAIEYMQTNSPSAELETIKEIERYFVMPAQATSYKIGMMKIQSLREEARKELGEKFDIREYHDIVLKDGSLPLEILESKVRNWTKERKKN